MDEFSPVEVAVYGGTLALSPMPGRTRHYATDWARLAAWRPDLVVSLTEQHELSRQGAGSLGTDLQGQGIKWLHLPIRDFGVPDTAFDVSWPSAEAQILDALASGGRVLVHCYGGCGRSGMIVLRVMRRAGLPDALTRLRQVRPCAIETEAQMNWALT